jgi:hypothetical protein
MTTTEVATVPFLAGTSISDSNTMLQETFADLDKVDGFQSFHLGTFFESPEDLQILVGKKKTISDHKNSRSSVKSYSGRLLRLKPLPQTGTRASTMKILPLRPIINPGWNASIRPSILRRLLSTTSTSNP